MLRAFAQRNRQQPAVVSHNSLFSQPDTHTDAAAPSQGLTSHNSLFSQSDTHTEVATQPLEVISHDLLFSQSGTHTDATHLASAVSEKSEKKNRTNSESFYTDCEKSEISEITLPADEDLEERAALIADGAGVPREWAEGFAALCSMPPPDGFIPVRWRRVVDAAGVFIDRWAGTAIACGWSDLDVFGAHPTRPDARFDAMGLVLLLDRCEVVSIDENGADLVTSTGARQRPAPAAAGRHN